MLVEEPRPVTLDLPLTMFLPAEYINSEPERLTLYRRLAAISTREELEAIAQEMSDRFGHMPEPALNLIASIRVKLAAREAKSPRCPWAVII